MLRLAHNPPMDSATALLMASFMSLLNGGVLGLMHASLLPELRPAAVDWRIGTLLFAGAGLLLGMLGHEDIAGALVAAYAMAFAGATLYWRSVRAFCGLPVDLGQFAPALAGGAILIAMVSLDVARGWRVAVISAVLAVLFALSGRTLARTDGRDGAVSRRVLYRLFYALAAGMVLRGGYFALAVLRPDVAAFSGTVDTATAVAIPALPVIGTTVFLLMCADRARAALQSMAETDDLTGLPNRRRITREAERRFARARAGRRGFAVAVIDVDFFKRINDDFGHEYGDAALRHVAWALRQSCPGPHLIGRQGGEEFVALLEVSELAAALELAERMRCAIEAAPFVTTACTRSISASIGVGLYRSDDAGYDDMLRRADLALYAAKARGRNRVESDAA